MDLDALTHHDVLSDGTRVLMRPLRPEDAALYPDFIAHVTPQDSRLREFILGGATRGMLSAMTLPTLMSH